MKLLILVLAVIAGTEAMTLNNMTVPDYFDNTTFPGGFGPNGTFPLPFPGFNGSLVFPEFENMTIPDFLSNMTIPGLPDFNMTFPVFPDFNITFPGFPGNSNFTTGFGPNGTFPLPFPGFNGSFTFPTQRPSFFPLPFINGTFGGSFPPVFSTQRPGPVRAGLGEQCGRLTTERVRCEKGLRCRGIARGLGQTKVCVKKPEVIRVSVGEPCGRIEGKRVECEKGLRCRRISREDRSRTCIPRLIVDFFTTIPTLRPSITPVDDSGFLPIVDDEEFERLP